MRKLVAGPVKARKDQTVRFYVTLREGMNSAYLEVFSARKGDDPSPHVPHSKLDMKHDGKPAFVQPTTCRLTRGIRENAVVEVTADENCRFYLYQDVDLADDATVKARTNKNVWIKIVQMLSRLVRRRQG